MAKVRPLRSIEWSPPVAVDATDNRKVEVDVEAAFRAHHDFVWRVVRCQGVSEEAVDDAVQDVYLTVHRRRHDYDARAPLRHWLYGIAKGVGRNHARKARRQAVRRDQLPEVTRGPTQESSVQRAEVAQLLERFLRTMNPKLREVFVLTHIDGMAGPEVARMLGVELNTVYSRLRRARRRFETMLVDAPELFGEDDA